MTLNKKEPRWQREQKGRKKKKQQSIFKSVFLLLFFILAVWVLINVFQIIRGGGWDGENRINLALISSEVEIVSFSPKDQNLTFLIFPKQTRIEVIHGYGQYRVEAIEALEKQEGRDDLLLGSLQESLGIPLNGWLKNSSDQVLTTKSEFLNELVRQAKGEGETQLSRWDLLRLWMQVRNTRFDRVNIVDLSKINVLSEITLADQTRAWEVDPARLDSRLGKLFIDGKIRAENLKIEVLNGTQHPGLAERGARLITNIGGDVIWLGNNQKKVDQCVVLGVGEQKGDYTIRKLTEIFRCNWREKKEDERAEVTLILGEDYWRLLTLK